MTEPLIARDIRDCCHSVVPLGDWVQEGWGCVLKTDGHTIRANPAGMRPSWIQLSVIPDDHEQYATIPFFRELSRGGTVKAYDERGFEHRPNYFGDGNKWLIKALQEALAYIERINARAAHPAGIPEVSSPEGLR